ncbi:potassium/sodium hyperpolarization-activated cyclic nucleotide-gated channel 1-like [Camellia sinensis]|uniref:potassium/sodium hyperpolarization-activated cyclic nucleotide-gated channel 1-like n=1 Tax=Camellia sinensis TaxID=4442 RepID=UPI0010364883|nr:potassium/sodium hyperpolarization-activated cyclic nucleotide-gated channel 1-like [Camellia sinensis]
MQVIQSQTESQQQAPLRQPQQMPRQMRPQMQQMVHPQNLAFQQQQQWKSMRQRQPSTSRPGMDNIKPLVEVKLENPAEFPIDSNALTAINARHHPQLQFRQQQIAAMSNFHPEASNQFRQLASLQIPQVQTQSMGTVRAPPVKVEGFQELMGGDATLKHDSEENKSTSPPK